MITEHQSGGRTVCVDLFNSSPEEIGEACTKYGLDIPPREQLEEIEFSSRLQYEDGVFTISVPVTPHQKDEDEDETSPLGFVLTQDMLVTIRFAHLHTFDTIKARVERRTRSAPDIFMVIIESLIDYGADRLEELRAEALRISQRIFHKEMQDWQKSRNKQNKHKQHDTQEENDDKSKHKTQNHDTLLVLQRAMPFVIEHGYDKKKTTNKTQHKKTTANNQSLND